MSNTTDNIKQFNSVGLDSIWGGLVDASGSFIGAGSSLANGADSGGFSILGPQSADITVPDMERVNVLGADGKLASYLFESDTETGFEFTAGGIDLDMAMASQGRAVQTVNNWEIAVLRPALRSPQTMWWVINSRAKSMTSGSTNNPGFIVDYVKLEISYLGSTGRSNKTPHAHRFSAVVLQSTVYPWGATVTGGAGDAFTHWSANRVRLHAFRGDNTDVTLTLPGTLFEPTDRVNVFHDGTLQTYTTDYTISGQVITWETGSKLTAAELGVIAYEYVP